MHRAPLREPSPLLRRNIFARAVADGKLFTGAGRFVVDRDRPICEDSSPPSVRLPRATRQKPRSQAVEDIPKHPGGAFGLTYRRFLSTGADFREEGVLRLKARVAHVSAGPRVPLLRRPARCREASLLSLARMQVERGSPYPSRACSPLAVYRAARLPGPGGAVVPSRNVTRAVFRSPPCRSPTSRLQSPWRAILDRLHVSSFVAPQTKTLKCPLRFATGTSNVGFQWESRLLLARLR